MLNTPCPYGCGSQVMPEPPNVPRPFAACPECGKRSRAKLTHAKGGETVVTYSATSLPKLGDGELYKS